MFETRETSWKRSDCAGWQSLTRDRRLAKRRKHVEPASKCSRRDATSGKTQLFLFYVYYSDSCDAAWVNLPLKFNTSSSASPAGPIGVVDWLDAGHVRSCAGVPPVATGCDPRALMKTLLAHISRRAKTAGGRVGSLLALAIAGCTSTARELPPASAPPITTASFHGLAPDFELPALDGSSLRLSQYKGKKVVLLDFWATFCAPCLAAMPHLEQMYLKYRSQGLEIVGVSIDGPESIAQVRAEVAKMGISFPVLLDQETRAVSLYNPRTSAPYSVLIDRNGVIAARSEGYTTGDWRNLEREILAALNQPF